MCEDGGGGDRKEAKAMFALKNLTIQEGLADV